ncbi:MAG: exodeoxyribonuclease V subunit beta [Betaproteobacteria bacterium]
MSAPLDVFACPLSGSTLIEASAGTGKTWAICALALRLIAERNLPVNEVLVVTFTNAATAELKERIRARLVETLAALDGLPDGPDPFVGAIVTRLEGIGIDRTTQRDRFAAALAGFDEAAIFTIHGFCQRALTEMPFAAGQPFALELADNAELCREAAADFWRRRIAFGELPEGFADWISGGKLTPTLLAGLLARHLGKPLAELRWPDPEASPPASAGAVEAAYAEAAARWAEDAEGAEQAMLAAIPALYANMHSAEKVVQGAIDWRCFFAAGNPFGEISACAENYRCAKHKVKGKQSPPCHPFFEAAEALIAAREALEATFAAVRLQLLRELLEWGLPEIRRRKRERRQQSFDDLLFSVYRALHGPGGETLAAALARRYGAALIDEFQDTDPLQFAIFQRIYGGRENPMFMVGDPKQAIYSFRQADLHTYLGARAAAGNRYTLAANQRSDAPLIGALNRLFGANPTAFMLDGLSFEPASVGDKPRQPFIDRSTPGAALQCWQLGAEDDPPDKETAMRQSAAAAAAEIARLVNAGHAGRIEVGGRPLIAGDIAVLVRTHAQGRRIKAALAEVGLAAAELSPESVFASGEAEELERILRALLEPTRPDVLKAGLATTPMGLDATAILALAEDDAALAGWVERHLDWRHAWQTRGIAHAIGRLVREAEIPGRLLAAPAGERRLTNLRHLTELLHQAESEHATPEALLGWFAARRADPPKDDAAQLRLESDRRLVSIVTIHKAKGLQYPVVFCPFVWEGGVRPQGRALPGQESHADGRAVIDFGDADDADAKLEFAAEQLRLLYVALTRAEHRLYLVCGPYCRNHSGKPSTAESRKSLLNWLVAGAGIAPEKWLKDGGDEAAIAAAWLSFAGGTPGIAIDPLPTGPGERALAAADQTELVARTASRHLRPDWRLDSFTGLLRGAEAPESAASDHDAQAVPIAPAADEAPPPVDALDILRFPRGPQAGDCIHAVFENVDFTDPAGWTPVIAEALAAFPPGSKLPTATLATMLRNLLDNVLATPLPAGARLAAISRRQRLSEMEFTLPANHLEAPALKALFARHGLIVPALVFRRLEGWLHGFIDLIFEADGRYWVADWKSNHLGERREHYAGPALELAMQHHGYHLQALIYQTALHRHLQRRLPGYDPARHLGGALYLFVRGVRPEWGDAGIHHLPANLGLLDQFSALLGS